MRSYVRFALTLFTVAVPSAVTGQSTFVGSDAAFGNPQGFINWQTLGPVGTAVANPTAVPVTGIPGLSALVYTSSNGRRVNEGNGWLGSFAVGDALISMGGPFGPMRFDFNNPIAAFGTQINTFFGNYGVYAAHIAAFDVTDDHLRRRCVV